MLPNFLVIGAQRSGTTTLFNYLRQHPAMFFSRDRKELNFFCHMAKRGAQLNEYKRYFREWRGEKCVGEASPVYLYYSYVPSLIANTIPDAKLIAVLRNPIARAYSHYLYTLSIKGLEWLPFNNALEKEDQRVQESKKRYGGEIWYYAYKDIGSYSIQFQRYLDYFPREQMLVLLFEDLIAEPILQLQKICEFLNIDESFSFDVIANKDSRTNFGLYPKFPRTHRFLASLSVNGSSLSAPGSWRVSRLARWLLSKMPLSNEYPEMDISSRQILEEYFTPLNQDLESLLQINLDKWNSE